jgi:hypothetical protein
MLDRLKNWVRDSRDRERIAIALSRGAAMRAARTVDLTRPETWEFSGFSQNGEDGLLEVLRSQLKSSNRYFVEIGAADGIENNTAWLLVAERYGGVMVEGDPYLAARAQRSVVPHSIAAEAVQMFVTKDNVGDIAARALFKDPDVFSLDIDGNDYHIANAVFACGFRPKIFVVEYNSVFGPERECTIPYQADFTIYRHPTQLWYGVSIAGWRKFFEEHGYRFVTVDRNGVNGFFVDPQHFEGAFLDGIAGCPWRENFYQLRKFRKSSAEQFVLIQGEPLHAI